MMAASGKERGRVDAAPGHLSRDQVLRLLEQRGHELREELARRPDADPDVLSFIAAEGTAAARRAVAANPKTPAQTDRLLADDEDVDVRVELAHKIGRLLPNLSQKATDRVSALTLETLQCLAEDELPRVREILAEEVKDLACVPKPVIAKLARDIECVAAPILEFSPLLSDADLIEIISSAQARFALSAIARRSTLSPSVSDAIANAMDIPSVAELLKNATARIRQKTLDKIIAQAERIREWHGPLAMRHDLSQRAVRRIASFVSAALVDELVKRNKLDDRTRLHLKLKMQERLDADGNLGSAPAVVAARHRAGTLDDRFVISAAQDSQRDIVVQALALKAAVPTDVVDKILASRLAKPVTALVWRAGLSMRVAFKIQSFLLHLPSGELLPARGGVHFPLTDDEMRWHLSYFGLDA